MVYEELLPKNKSYTRMDGGAWSMEGNIHHGTNDFLIFYMHEGLHPLKGSAACRVLFAYEELLLKNTLYTCMDGGAWIMEGNIHHGADGS